MDFPALYLSASPTARFRRRKHSAPKKAASLAYVPAQLVAECGKRMRIRDTSNPRVYGSDES
jgi:hypothetical protein